jgi:hypothetical protein
MKRDNKKRSISIETLADVHSILGWLMHFARTSPTPLDNATLYVNAAHLLKLCSPPLPKAEANLLRKPMWEQRVEWGLLDGVKPTLAPMRRWLKRLNRQARRDVGIDTVGMPSDSTIKRLLRTWPKDPSERAAQLNARRAERDEAAQRWIETENEAARRRLKN